MTINWEDLPIGTIFKTHLHSNIYMKINLEGRDCVVQINNEPIGTAFYPSQNSSFNNVRVLGKVRGVKIDD